MSENNYYAYSVYRTIKSNWWTILFYTEGQKNSSCTGFNAKRSHLHFLTFHQSYYSRTGKNFKSTLIFFSLLCITVLNALPIRIFRDCASFGWRLWTNIYRLHLKVPFILKRYKSCECNTCYTSSWHLFYGIFRPLLPSWVLLFTPGWTQQ